MRRSTRSTVLLFSILVLYMLLQSAWWMWLLLSKDRDILALQGQLASAGLQPLLPIRLPGHSLLMVIGEGSVFLLLLLGGLWVTYRSVRHDLRLARQQQDFLLAVSHELRTPIAGLKLHLQTLERHDLHGDQRQRLTRHAREEVERLHQLTERILLASHLETRAGVLPTERTDLAAMARDMLREARLTYGAAHELALEAPEQLPLHTDPQAFRSVLTNLVENACKYAPPGTPVHIALERLPTGALLRVADQGPGIPEEEQQHLWKKFYRGGSEATRTTKGVGLGLFIAKRSMEELGGSLRHMATRPHGATFEARFPDHP
jgi:signal transduction histidine kinase